MGIGIWAKPVTHLFEYNSSAGDASSDNSWLFSRNLKHCPRCKQILPLDAFTKRSNGYAVSKCRECMSAYYYERADEVRDKARARRFGIFPGTYEGMIAEFGARCMICGTTEPGGTGRNNKQFCIDHDERTGYVRGLLCTQCNVGIGMLKHDTEVLRSAIAYLEKAEENNPPIPNPVGIEDLDL